MSKEKLSIASTEPVSLDETTPTASTKIDSADTAQKGTRPDIPAIAAKNETKTELPTVGSKTATVAKPDAADEDDDAPAQPPRPLSPAAQIKKDLKEAFPQIEAKYIEAVLIASQGRTDPAFTALLFLLDPSFEPEPVVAPRNENVPKQSSVTDDEALARQLQKEFEREDRRRRSHSRRLKNLPPAPADDSPDEFDQIKETFTQGFEEAKTTLNSWVSGISKKFSQEDNEPHRQQAQHSGPNQGPKLFGALGGSSFNTNTRKSKNFDEDPEILALDFSRKVDLDEDRGPQLPQRDPQAKKEDKWQPLNSDVPVTSDAFLVTDLEDEDKDRK